ncbi:MAG: alpha/beta hydrolase [Desulfobacterales bacterium]|nr:alpha/beta hydrolase [Desulfobacterales bacterium]MBL7205666.1 alpha/beta hydrolase [Desulfobacteraceae bacterium]
MTVLTSRDLKGSLGDHQIVTAEDLRVCLAHPSQTIETAYGPVEYALRGEGPVVLIAHGGPGGYDQALVLGELFRKNGFKVIAPSRPGYLGTPLQFGKTAEEQGDFMAALLDALDIPDAVMVGASGGGPAGYQLAQRHPERVKALLVIDGISMNYTKADDVNKVEEWMYLSRPGQWLMGYFFKHFPAAVVKSFLQTESTLEKHDLGKRVKEIVGDADKFALVDAMFKTMSDRFEERKPGAENDIALGSAIDKLPLDKIAAATLIIHGDADNDVPPRDAVYAHEAIAEAQLLWIDKASHIGFWVAGDAYKVQKYTLDWLRVSRSNV